jgi:hypothetical protein
VVILFLVGFSIGIIGLSQNIVELQYLGFVIIGMGEGIAMVNAFPVWLVDKNRTDAEWKEKHEK